MSKFKVGDIIYSKTTDNNLLIYSPFLILGEHTFPGSIKAYKYKSVVHQYCDDTGEDLGPSEPGYNTQEYLDQYELLWRRE